MNLFIRTASGVITGTFLGKAEKVRKQSGVEVLMLVRDAEGNERLFSTEDIYRDEALTTHVFPLPQDLGSLVHYQGGQLRLGILDSDGTWMLETRHGFTNVGYGENLEFAERMPPAETIWFCSVHLDKPYHFMGGGVGSTNFITIYAEAESADEAVQFVIEHLATKGIVVERVDPCIAQNQFRETYMSPEQWPRRQAMKLKPVYPENLEQSCEH